MKKMKVTRKEDIKRDLHHHHCLQKQIHCRCHQEIVQTVHRHYQREIPSPTERNNTNDNEKSPPQNMNLLTQKAMHQMQKTHQNTNSCSTTSGISR